MWDRILRSKKAIREDLQGLKKISVNGIKFKIRKVNPFLDFPAEKMPQIFSYYFNRRKPAEKEPEVTPQQVTKGIEEMKTVIKAGVVEPALGPDLSLDDIFRWSDTGPKLYLEIIAHSLNQFKGLKGVFFSIRIRRLLFTSWRKTMAANPSEFSFPKAVTP